ncbi:hypothetical protein QAD02_007239 [Eretmocerus hayati]|uniref:Uncharacterized protein n=1 Tax=Eretmocerus hayati TaxID=131215 RepID=A0ACC2N5J0_9HYME|nr:hypothetical protein QAD02_007239 [Eretmocerus hayati]
MKGVSAVQLGEEASTNAEATDTSDAQEVGDCLLKAISKYLYGHEDRHVEIRLAIVKYVYDNCTELVDILISTCDSVTYDSKEHYRLEMSKYGVVGTKKRGTYGTDFEVGVFVRLYNKSVTLFREVVAKGRVNDMRIIKVMYLGASGGTDNPPFNFLFRGSARNGHWLELIPKIRLLRELSINHSSKVVTKPTFDEKINDDCIDHSSENAEPDPRSIAKQVESMNEKSFSWTRVVYRKTRPSFKKIRSHSTERPPTKCMNSLEVKMLGELASPDLPFDYDCANDDGPKQRDVHESHHVSVPICKQGAVGGSVLGSRGGAHGGDVDPLYLEAVRAAVVHLRQNPARYLHALDHITLCRLRLRVLYEVRAARDCYLQPGGFEVLDQTAFGVVDRAVFHETLSCLGCRSVSTTRNVTTSRDVP